MTVTLTVDRVRVSASAAQYVLAISARIMVSRGRGCLSLSIAVCAFGYTHRALTERLRALSLDTTVDTPHAARRSSRQDSVHTAVRSYMLLRN